MYFVEIDLDRIPETFPAMREWIESLNSVRETPINVTMAIEDDQAIAVMLHASNRLIHLAVDPSARRQSVGKSMLGYLRNQYTGDIVAYVPPAQTNAVAFFSAMGATINGTFKDAADVLHLRMVLGKASKANTPPEEAVLLHYLKNTPVFVSVADKMI